MSRIVQLDYLKGVLILLMVTFHLSLIEDTYPLMHDIVYTFHMPAFLIISGYLAHLGERDTVHFLKFLLTRLVIPYLLFESLYLLALFYLGNVMNAHNAISSLSLADYFRYVALEPLGTYWYLHTLIISLAACHLVYRVLRLKEMSALILSGILLYSLSLCIKGIDWENAIYVLMGVFVSKNSKSLLAVITPSLIAVVPLILLCYSPDNLNRGALSGIAITILAVSLLLSLYPLLGIVGKYLAYLGRNTLSIVVFSPMFTIITKTWTPFFSFDASAICFLVVALTFVVAGCLFCAWILDKVHLSLYLFGKKNIYIR